MSHQPVHPLNGRRQLRTHALILLGAFEACSRSRRASGVDTNGIVARCRPGVTEVKKHKKKKHTELNLAVAYPSSGGKRQSVLILH